MKKFLFLLAISFLALTAVRSQVYIGSDGAMHSVGPFGFYYSNEGVGTPKSVGSLAERDAIPAYLRQPGMLCYVQSDSLYFLNGCITNSCWVGFSKSNDSAVIDVKVVADTSLVFIKRNGTNDTIPLSILVTGSDTSGPVTGSLRFGREDGSDNVDRLYSAPNNGLTLKLHDFSIQNPVPAATLRGVFVSPESLFTTVAPQLHVQIGRCGVSLFGKSRNDRYQAIWDAGFIPNLVISYYPINTNNNFPSGSAVDDFKRKAADYIDGMIAYGVTRAFISVENEPGNLGYRSLDNTSSGLYLQELAYVAQYCHSKAGVDYEVGDGGATGPVSKYMQYNWMESNGMSSQAAAFLDAEFTPGVKSNILDGSFASNNAFLIQFYTDVFGSEKSAGADYTNFHWYSSTNDTQPGSPVVADIGYAKTAMEGMTGLPAITNEIGQHNYLDTYPPAIIQELSDDGMKWWVWYSGSGGPDDGSVAQPLHDENDGTLLSNGNAFAAKAQAMSTGGSGSVEALHVSGGDVFLPNVQEDGANATEALALDANHRIVLRPAGAVDSLVVHKIFTESISGTKYFDTVTVRKFLRLQDGGTVKLQMNNTQPKGLTYELRLLAQGSNMFGIYNKTDERYVAQWNDAGITRLFNNLELQKKTYADEDKIASTDDTNGDGEPDTVYEYHKGELLKTIVTSFTGNDTATEDVHLIMPKASGTLARLEDLQALGGGGDLQQAYNTSLTNGKTAYQIVNQDDGTNIGLLQGSSDGSLSSTMLLGKGGAFLDYNSPDGQTRVAASDLGVTLYTDRNLYNIQGLQYRFPDERARFGQVLTKVGEDGNIDKLAWADVSGGGGAVPPLDQVLAAGNIDYEHSIVAKSYEIRNTDDNNRLVAAFEPIVNSSENVGGGLSLKAVASNYYFQIQPPFEATTNYLSVLPKANGVLAMSVNGQTADQNGNINIGANTIPNIQQVMTAGNLYQNTSYPDVKTTYTPGSIQMLSGTNGAVNNYITSQYAQFSDNTALTNASISSSAIYAGHTIYSPSYDAHSFSASADSITLSRTAGYSGHTYSGMGSLSLSQLYVSEQVTPQGQPKERKMLYIPYPTTKTGILSIGATINGTTVYANDNGIINLGTVGGGSGSGITSVSMTGDVTAPASSTGAMVGTIGANKVLNSMINSVDYSKVTNQPGLQQVTNVGNTTTNPLKVIINEGGVHTTSYEFNRIVNEGSFSIVTGSSGYTFNPASTNPYQVTFNAGALTSNTQLDLPNTGNTNHRTLTLSVNGTFADANGNISVATSGVIQYWQRTGIVLSPLNDGDRLALNDAGTAQDNGYNGKLGITRATSAAQYMNFVRAGQHSVSIGYLNGTNTFAIGQGQGTDANFTAANAYITFDQTSKKTTVQTIQISGNSPAANAVLGSTDANGNAAWGFITNANLSGNAGITDANIASSGNWNQAYNKYPVSGTVSGTSINFVARDGSPAFTVTGLPSGGGGVNSVSNSDGTLTVSPTTGAVVASINLANPDTWTGAQTFNGALTKNFSNDSRIVINQTTDNNYGFGFSYNGTTKMQQFIAGASGDLYFRSEASGIGAILSMSYATGNATFYKDATVTNTISANKGVFTLIQIPGGAAANTVLTGDASGNGTWGKVGNAALTNSTISGVALGSSLAALTPGNGFSGSAYDGSTARTWTYNPAVIADLTTAQTLTNKTIAAGNNTISGLTNANLSGSAGITDANIASSANWNQAYNKYVVSGTVSGTSINFVSRDGTAAFTVTGLPSGGAAPNVGSMNIAYGDGNGNLVGDQSGSFIYNVSSQTASVPTLYATNKAIVGTLGFSTTNATGMTSGNAWVKSDKHLYYSNASGTVQLDPIVVTGAGGTNKYFQFLVGTTTYYLPAYTSLPN